MLIKNIFSLTVFNQNNLVVSRKMITLGVGLPGRRAGGHPATACSYGKKKSVATHHEQPHKCV